MSYKIYPAASGTEALEILRREDIDLLVTDFKMPGMNGLEVIARAGDIDPMLQSIVVTGYSDLKTAIDVMGAGAFNYLLKPVDFKELDLTIEKGLEKRQLLQEVQNKQHQLGEYRQHLEELVEKRTWALTETNLALKKEIEERKQLEISLREAKVIAENANKAKSEFLANMSHEIRTPMTSAIGLINLVLDTELLPKQKTYLEMARISTVVMHNLLNDILDFSKIEAGKLTLESIPFDPRKVIESVIDLQHFQAEEKKITLSSYTDNDVPHTIIGDPSRLRQILLNLVSNGIKFTPFGEVVITCKNTKDGEQGSIPPDGEYEPLHFSVVDSGIGIDKDKIDHIFEAFTQADSSTTRKYGGVGLGLNICSKLVAMMGGKLWAVSEPGRGSTFHFTCKFGKEQVRNGSEGESKVKAPNTFVLNREVFNESDALKKASGKREVMIRRIKVFLQEAPGTIEMMRNRLVYGEKTLFEQEVHRLNELAMEVGATNLADALFSLIMSVRKNQPVDASQMELLATECEYFHNDLKILQLAGESK